MDVVVQFLIDENFLPADAMDAVVACLHKKMFSFRSSDDTVGLFTSLVLPAREVFDASEPVYVVHSLTERDAYVNGLNLLLRVLLRGPDSSYFSDSFTTFGADDVAAVVKELQRDLLQPEALSAEYWGFRAQDFNERLTTWQLFVCPHVRVADWLATPFPKTLDEFALALADDPETFDPPGEEGDD
jgi:hypothetical protein